MPRRTESRLVCGKWKRGAACALRREFSTLSNARCALRAHDCAGGKRVPTEGPAQRFGPLNALFALVTAMSLSIPAAAASASIQ